MELFWFDFSLLGMCQFLYFLLAKMLLRWLWNIHLGCSLSELQHLRVSFLNWLVFLSCHIHWIDICCLSSTWIPTLDAYFLISCCTLFSNDFLSLLNFLICVNNFSLWFLNREISSFLTTVILSILLCIFCNTYFPSWDITFEISDISSGVTELGFSVTSWSVIFFFP